MSTNADIKLDAGGRGSPKEGVNSSSEARRWYGTLAMADYHLDTALANTYPDLMPAVQLEVNGEAPGYSDAAARTSTAAAHQAIQGALATPRPELN